MLFKKLSFFIDLVFFNRKFDGRGFGRLIRCYVLRVITMTKVFAGIFGIFLIVVFLYFGFMKFILNEQSSADISGLGTVYVGSTINHTRFGVGKVEKIHKSEENHTLVVEFTEEGTKALIAELSPIEIQKN